eukprot:TRINITY_DN2907_c0_g1_i6.p1 TRINITY_DN2907_c0_g1~~TRINITY_DN2907_c0_g1_i6.p1  ORF type:complete len:114 (+),score=8.45 TRINITY_DN2907_c0_g1_i6:142-483(+)
MGLFNIGSAATIAFSGSAGVRDCDSVVMSLSVGRLLILCSRHWNLNGLPAISATNATAVAHVATLEHTGPHRGRGNAPVDLVEQTGSRRIHAIGTYLCCKPSWPYSSEVIDKT